jgi:copper(I)-binding protein
MSNSQLRTVITIHPTQNTVFQSLYLKAGCIHIMFSNVKRYTLGRRKINKKFKEELVASCPLRQEPQYGVTQTQRSDVKCLP